MRKLINWRSIFFNLALLAEPQFLINLRVVFLPSNHLFIETVT
jgi:hypothetical protein